MNVTRFDMAPEYIAAGHINMRCLRLQGYEVGPAENIWLEASIIEPGGYIEPSGSPSEKHYVVLSGSVKIITDTEEAELKAFDSCRLAPGERRMILNTGAGAAVVLLAMPCRSR